MTFHTGFWMRWRLWLTVSTLPSNTAVIQAANICFQVTAAGLRLLIGPKLRLKLTQNTLLFSGPKYDSDQPTYPGFERDVFKTVSDHFYSLPQPLLTYELYELFINVLGRYWAGRKVFESLGCCENSLQSFPLFFGCCFIILTHFDL